MSENEKRGFVRIRDEFDVHVKHSPVQEPDAGDELPTSRSIDVSAGGILIKTDRSLDTGERVKISFITPKSADMFEGKGIIVRRVMIDEETFSLAIEFDEMSDRERSTLDQYIRRAWEG